MASNSPKYPRMKDWKLRVVENIGCIYAAVYGPKHTVDGNDYAPLFTTTDRDFAREIVRRWNRG